jgi:hypothetical protein
MCCVEAAKVFGYMLDGRILFRKHGAIDVFFNVGF